LFVSFNDPSAAKEDDKLKTGLEIRNDGSWTTHQEELDFLG